MIMIYVTILTALVAMAQVSPEIPSSLKGNVCKTLFASCSDFTNILYTELSSAKEGNIVSSPLSIHMILSLLSHGAEGATLDELSTGLFHKDVSVLKEEYKSLISTLNDAKGVELYIANAMYVQDSHKLLTAFQSTGMDVYRSSIRRLDFKNSIRAAEEINTWVKETTRDKISDLVSSGDFNESTRLLLINAIYFNGRWLYPFDVKNTEKKIFHVTKELTKSVPMMFKKFKCNNGEISNLFARFIEIPYMNQDIIMTIILPHEVNGLEVLESNFDWMQLVNAHRKKNEVELYLPKFKFEFTVDLENILRKIGLNTIFEDKADFKLISDTPLKVSKIVHKAVIEVTEQGTEAAAATAVHLRLRRMIDSSEQFLVDRPFMFLIEHKPSNMPLFLGRVRDVEGIPGRDEL